jgi:methyl-accepting chemotaxis protein
VPEERAVTPSKPIRRRRLPIGFQVLLAAGGLLSLLAISMVLAIVLVMNLDRERTQQSDRDMRYVNAVAAAALNAKAVASDQRGFLLTGDPRFLAEANQRAGATRLAFAEAVGAAADPGQRRAISQARSGFERWGRALQTEVERFQSGDRQAAITASMGVDRALRKTYEQALANAQSMGASSIESARTSDAAASSRSVRILLICFLVALAIGSVMAFWLVRSIAMPVSRLMAILRVDMPSRGSA